MSNEPASFKIKAVEDSENKPRSMAGGSQKNRTSDYMTKYEYTRLIACRAVEIEHGALSKIDAEDIYDPMEIARMELHARVIPLVIVRTLQDGTSETWYVKDMHIRDY